MKIALAMMVKDFVTEEPLLAFLENARQYGHQVDLVLIGWQNSCSQLPLKRLQEVTLVKTVALRDPAILGQLLGQIGLEAKYQKPLLPEVDVNADKPMPYGLSRNQLLLTALLEGMDVLFYIDDDVYPSRLWQDGSFETIDFFGGHLKYLKEAKVVATTSDYTGFDIVPSLPIDQWQFFLKALNKQPFMALRHEASSAVHTEVRETSKLLGGNLALKLEGVKSLGGFYSTVLDFRGQRYLGRGEDTLLGLAIEKSQDWRAMDIDMRIFHNAFKDYPQVPDLVHSKTVRDRFFYASMGWIARNPLLDEINQRPEAWRERHKLLLETSPKLSEALDDPRFSVLPDAMLEAQKQLEREKRQLNTFMEAWEKLRRCLY